MQLGVCKGKQIASVAKKARWWPCQTNGLSVRGHGARGDGARGHSARGHRARADTRV